MLGWVEGAFTRSIALNVRTEWTVEFWLFVGLRTINHKGMIATEVVHLQWRGPCHLMVRGMPAPEDLFNSYVWWGDLGDIPNGDPNNYSNISLGLLRWITFILDTLTCKSYRRSNQPKFKTECGCIQLLLMRSEYTVFALGGRRFAKFPLVEGCVLNGQGLEHQLWCHVVGMIMTYAVLEMLYLGVL